MVIVCGGALYDRILKNTGEGVHNKLTFGGAGTRLGPKLTTTCSGVIR